MRVLLSPLFEFFLFYIDQLFGAQNIVFIEITGYPEIQETHHLMTSLGCVVNPILDKIYKTLFIIGNDTTERTTVQGIISAIDKGSEVHADYTCSEVSNTIQKPKPSHVSNEMANGEIFANHFM